MSLIKLETSATLSPEQKDKLLADLSETVSEAVRKGQAQLLINS